MFGPPSFDVAVNGQPVLNEREQAHMRDVRGVFAGFAVLGDRRGRRPRRGLCRGTPSRPPGALVAGGAGRGAGTIVGVVVGGVIVFFAFDAAFEVFHRLFFAGGTYLFDPATDRLVQLFPFKFWDETTMVVGAVIVAISLLVAFVAGRRARRAAAAHGRRRGRAGAAGRAVRVGAGLVNGVPIARLFGIEIRLHLSWIFIVAIITVTVGGRLTDAPADRRRDAAAGRDARLGDRPRGLARVHAHGHRPRARPRPRRASLRDEGDVDLGPLHRLAGGRRRPGASTPRAEAAIALAGPLTSLAIGLILVAVAFLTVLSASDAVGIVADVLVIVGTLNLVLAGVSLVPAFPLDGGRVVRAIGWARTGDPRRGARLAGDGRAGDRLAARRGRARGDPAGREGRRDPRRDHARADRLVPRCASARSVDRWLVMDGLIAGRPRRARRWRRRWTRSRPS